MEDFFEKEVGIDNMIQYCMDTGQIQLCQFVELLQCESPEQKTELLKQHLGHEN